MITCRCETEMMYDTLIRNARHTAAHKMTDLSAARFGLKERGEFREGHWADLVLFDPATIRNGRPKASTACGSTAF